MRSRRAVLLAVFLVLLLFWSIVPAGRSQPAGSLTVAADYELFGSSELTGGGHITWTLTGSAAQALRAKILGLFDDYTQIPRGFSNAGPEESYTSGNGDGMISLAEGQSYTSAVDRYLENQAVGSQVGYYLLRKASLFDTDPTLGFERSTTGIVNAQANSTADLQIRFITEGASTVQNLVMNLSTDTYVRALEDIFSFEADQSPTLTAGLYPGAWPLVEETNASQPGWHTLSYDAAHRALWAGEMGSCTLGNESSCTYAPNANLSVETYIDPTLATKVPYLDLRFASQAWVTFNYTGQVADSGDAMEVQVAPGPAYAAWTTLANGTFSLRQNTGAGEWRSASVDLSGYLGDRVRLRLLFQSNGSGESSGFFVRDFGIHAPSTYLGPVVESDAHYLIGTLSFSGFSTPSGGVTLFRTPGGEILYYSSTWQGSVPPDVVRFETFNVLENPQVLFAVMVVAAYLISRLQGRAYDAYREAYPSVYRAVARKAKSLHRLGIASILFLILCYFVPTWPYVLGLRVYVNGPAYWFLALALTLGLGLGTRAYYRQKLEEVPPPPGEGRPAPRLTQERAAPPAEEVLEPEAPAVACTQCLRPIASGERTYACTCGAVYHASCAGTLLRCATCHKPIGLEVVPSGRAVSMRCSACGEVQTIPEGTDPRTATCAACGGSLRSLDAGKRYLLIASNPSIAFRWTSDLARGGKPVLCVTASAPDRLRLEFGLKGVRFLRVSTEGGDAVDPRKLDPVGLKAILPLTRDEKGGVLLYDGLDQMISAASTGDILRFLRKANDLAFVHEVTVIGRIAPGRLADAEIDRLAQEFDEVLDLSARI